MDSGETPRRGRGRPRVEGADEKILTAALEEYGEHGWAGFTVDGLARRAGVGKSTVYLRWTDKDAILTEAVSTLAKQLAPEDTGSLRGDLEALTLRALTHFHSPEGWAAVRVILDAASSTERLGAFTDTVTEAHGLSVDEICERAVVRGEISPDVLSGLVGETLFGSTMVHAITDRLDNRGDTAEVLVERARQITDLIIEGCVRTSPVQTP